MRTEDADLEALIEAARLKLGAADELQQKPAPSERQFGPYHVAAAVLATFDTKALWPCSEPVALAAETEQHQNIDALIADSKLVRAADGAERWTLRMDLRRAILRSLETPERIQSVLATNAASRPINDPAQEMFEAYLRGQAPALEEQTSRQLTGTSQVVSWLENLDIVSELPQPEAVRRRSQWLALLQPFYDLAGVHFAGRVEQLATLRDYVGVMPPGSVRERLNRIAQSIFNLHEKPPLVICGPGGRGKSTLVARFIWEHATLRNTESFPWAYLDFDRPGLLAEEPLTLLIEAVRQLGIQYPEAAQFCERIRNEWLKELGERPAQIKQAMTRNISQNASAEVTRLARPEEQQRHLRDFGALLSNLKVDTDPFLLVLDTFEVVQYRSDVVVRGLCEFLESFQRHVPRLRTVIAGRAALDRGVEFPTKTVVLGDFDEAAAVGYLARKGVSETQDAKRLHALVGGNPLSLRLAAEEWVRSGGASLQNIQSRTLLGFRVKENEVQAQLFARVLNHIHDPDVRRLAYPGLVLRRVTSDIIQKVLARPCGVDVPDATVAERLFKEMAREVGLVTVEGDALIHRADVRRLVLRLLREREPEKVEQIETAAVAYYASRAANPIVEQRLVERAEEIYHRLSLRQPLEEIARRWEEGVKPFLFGALEELPVRERLWLATRVGHSLTEQEREQADLDGWERDTAQRVRHFMQQGLMRQAQAALRERADRLPGSTLFAIEAEVHEALGAWSEVDRTVQAGIRSADEAGNRDLAIVLRIRGIRSDIRSGDLANARRKLDEASTLLEEGMTLRAIELGLHRIALLRAERGDKFDPEDQLVAESLRILNDQFESLSDADVRNQSALMAWVATELGTKYPEVLQRLTRLTGLETQSPGRLRTLAQAITAVDATQPVPGTLANKIGVPAAQSLTERWTQFVLSASAMALGGAISGLISSVPAIATAVIDVLRERARERLVPNVGLAGWKRFESQVPANSSSYTVGERSASFSPRALRLNSSLAREFRHAMLTAFLDRDDLARMLRYKLDRNLDSIAPRENLRDVIDHLISYAEAEGWSAQLLAAARESSPASPELQQFAAKFGLAVTLPEQSKLEEMIKSTNNPWIDVDTWQSHLGRMEGRVCRVEMPRRSIPRRYATGFLVGPDLVMTAFHVIAPVVRREVSPWDVVFRFDYRQMSDGATVEAGTKYRLAEQDWLVDANPTGLLEKELTVDPEQGPSSDELDYVLLRLARQAGADPIGGDRAEPSATPRGWLSMSRAADFSTSGRFFILHYTVKGPLMLTFMGDTRLSVAGTRLHYDASTSAGSSGAPCFDAHWNLVAMHLASAPGRGYQIGVPSAAIIARLERNGLAHLLDQLLA